ncbi:hypothetical protein SELMODRAFT_438838 [Selaginella moellendorffii]|uniref:Uncharacterized protein n=1 Tax=Selaginella moellendorffii TaxID=88036 RepID=D8QZT6_SELML|nr:hypothetical protein SELMODRAFT_438838 [Selaginella moellendorffii]
MGRWRLGRVASKLWSWRSSSPLYSQTFASSSIAEEGPQWKTTPLAGSKLSRAWMATKAGGGGGSKRAIEDFEKYVLGNAGGEEEETDFHDFPEESSGSTEQQASAEERPEEDDFLQELTRIEKGADRKERRDSLMTQRGYDEENVPFDDDVDPENHESMLDQDDAVFWSEELQKFVTPKGLLNLPGMGRDDFTKPYQLRPDRVYFPGQTIEPEFFFCSHVLSF